MACTYLYVYRNNPVLRQELIMQKTEEEQNSQEYDRGWEHKWRDLPSIRAGKDCGGRDGALITIVCSMYPVLGIY